LYTVKGIVEKGKGKGTGLGFATANLSIAHAQDVAYGVYAGRVRCRGRAYKAIVNVGAHPTLPAGRPTVEAHLIDASVNLYGMEITVELLIFIRAEMKFDTVEALRQQVQKDIDTVRRITIE